MKMRAFVEKGGNRSFSCRAERYVNDFLLIGYGNTAAEAIDDLHVAYNELKAEGGDSIPAIDFDLEFDVGSLFDYYRFLNMEGVARLSGIYPSVLRQYASGARVPKASTLSAIKDGLAKAAEQMKRVVLSA